MYDQLEINRCIFFTLQILNLIALVIIVKEAMNLDNPFKILFIKIILVIITNLFAIYSAPILSAEKKNNKQCKVVTTDLEDIIKTKQLAHETIQLYSHVNGGQQFNLAYKQLTKLQKKPKHNISSKQLDRIKTLINKLDTIYEKIYSETQPLIVETQLNNDRDNNTEDNSPKLEVLSPDTFEVETAFQTQTDGPGQAVLIFSEKLITKINKKNPNYFEEMIKQSNKGIVSHGQGIAQLPAANTKNITFEVYEVRSVGRRFGAFRVYGAKVDELPGEIPVIRFVEYVQDHLLKNGSINNQLIIKLKNEFN